MEPAGEEDERFQHPPLHTAHEESRYHQANVLVKAAFRERRHPRYEEVAAAEVAKVRDLQQEVNIVVGGTDGFTDYQLWAADVNSDSIINVLDIVLLVNIVVDQ